MTALVFAHLCSGTRWNNQVVVPQLNDLYHEPKYLPAVIAYNCGQSRAGEHHWTTGRAPVWIPPVSLYPGAYHSRATKLCPSQSLWEQKVPPVTWGRFSAIGEVREEGSSWDLHLVVMEVRFIWGTLPSV